MPDDASTDAAPPVTAAVLVIGDEILSGRTKDKNVGTIAEALTLHGIDLREVRVVPDVAEEIVSAVNALRTRYTHVFTTGGIGPTHDDITADAIAAAFGVGIDHDERAVEMMAARYGRETLNEARLRMARIPDGASLVENPVSAAPGFRIGNVTVMAGVPKIMEAMLGNVLPTLPGGRPVLSEQVSPGLGIGEGMIATELAAIAASHPEVSIGSYPASGPEGYQTHLIIRGRDAGKVKAARVEVERLAEDARRRLAAGQR